jgi:putative ABC transport system permease protein
MILGIAALAIGVPLGVAAGQSVSAGVMDLLNFNVFNSAVPIWAIALQAGIGLLIPLFAAFSPIFKGSRITVREAIGSNGSNTKNFGESRMDRALERIRKLPRMLALSLRNTFRRKGRLALALLMLSLGGATFIASLASAASWNLTIDNAFNKIGYDIDVRFGGQYPVSSVEETLRAVPGVSAAEAWGYAMSTSFPKYSDGTYGGATVIFAPPDGTKMIAPQIIAGRWLHSGDANDMVVDTDFIDNAAKQGTPVGVGDDITFSINGKDTVWHIVGVMDKIGFQSASYVNYGRFAAVTGQMGKAACARVAVQGHDKGLQKSVAQALEQTLGKDGFSVFIIQDLTLTRQVMVNHVVLILALLMFMSILVAAIGALGLASTVGINVLERTREIGIMRSIGASAGAIIRSVVLEGILTAVLSWVLAVLLSIPLTVLIAGNTGQFVFPRVMAVAYPAWAPLLWLGITIIVSSAASFFPARRAAKLTIREVLAYE